MSRDQNSGTSFWAAASAPKTPMEAHLRSRRAAQTPPPVESEPGPSPIEAVAAMDAASYAAARDSLMADHGGPRRSSESDFQGVDMPRGRAGPMLDADALAALMPWRSQGDRPVQGREISSEYNEAARLAQQNTGLAVPNRVSTQER